MTGSLLQPTDHFEEVVPPVMQCHGEALAASSLHAHIVYNENSANEFIIQDHQAQHSYCSNLTIPLSMANEQRMAITEHSAYDGYYRKGSYGY
jgi:hypothetical protein